jgi:hypothetical protein
MNTKFNPDKIAQLLTQSTRQMDARTLSALSQARHNALERQEAHAPVFALAGTDRSSHWLAQHAATQWIAAGLLAATLVLASSYYHHSQEQQIGELDVAILTDELPMEVFVD